MSAQFGDLPLHWNGCVLADDHQGPCGFAPPTSSLTDADRAALRRLLLATHALLAEAQQLATQATGDTQPTEVISQVRACLLDPTLERLVKG